MKIKILIIVAHPDDEVLGCGGAILKHVNSGDEVKILVLADGESSRNQDFDIKKRQNQARLAAVTLGVKEIILESFPDNKMDTIALLDIVKVIEKKVNDFQPEIIYTHSVIDLNVDHHLTFKAVLTACRPQPGFFVKKILSFEIPSSTEWQIKDSVHAFCPTEYIDITDFIAKKIDCLKIYQDDLRQYPHPRSVEGVNILAKYRGMEVGLKYAEAFQIIRLIR